MHVQEQRWSPDPVWLARDVLSATSSMDDSQVRALIGSGPGLTPAGDDYLLGYLAALWPWRKHTALASHLQHVQTLIKTHIGCTTDISRFYLDQAVEGHFSEPVHGLMGAVIRKAPCNEALASARDVMNYGASSGADAMAGLLRGLRVVASLLHRSRLVHAEPFVPSPQDGYGTATTEAPDAPRQHIMDRQ